MLPSSEFDRPSPFPILVLSNKLQDILMFGVRGTKGTRAEKLTRSFLNIVDKTTGALLPNDQSINFFMSRL